MVGMADRATWSVCLGRRFPLSNKYEGLIVILQRISSIEKLDQELGQFFQGCDHTGRV